MYSSSKSGRKDTLGADDDSYAEFVTISKEISTLENDMLELKELLGQWKDLPQLMGMEDTLAPTVDKNGNRMSSLFTYSLSDNFSRATSDPAQLRHRPTSNVQVPIDQSLVYRGRITKIPANSAGAAPRLRNSQFC